jgi:hypothetical protein
MRRLPLILAIVLVGAARPSVAWFSPAQAIRALTHDDAEIAECMQDHPNSVRAGLEIQAISTKPKLALVQVQSTCICGAQNCPFWVYRVENGKAEKLLDGFAIAVGAKPQTSAWPDIVAAAHDSALITDGTRFAYRHGTYEPVENWRIRGDTGERKTTNEISFAPGTSAKRLRGTVSANWGDIYTFTARTGQRLTVSSLDPARGIDVAISSGGNAPISVVANTAVVLPAGGDYQLTVDPVADVTNLRYAFTLSIR